jgi:hypothetical protein
MLSFRIYNAERGTMDFRHYIIMMKAKEYGVSRRVCEVLDAAAHTSIGSLNLGRERDAAGFMLRKKGEPGPDGGYRIGSSAESVSGDNFTPPQASPLFAASHFIISRNARSLTALSIGTIIFMSTAFGLWFLRAVAAKNCASEGYTEFPSLASGIEEISRSCERPTRGE